MNDLARCRENDEKIVYARTVPTGTRLRFLSTSAQFDMARIFTAVVRFVEDDGTVVVSHEDQYVNLKPDTRVLVRR